jgi:glutamyl-tRNA reductase
MNGTVRSPALGDASERPSALRAPAVQSSESAADALLCVGISHRTAPIALRERLYLAAPRVTALLTRFAAQRHGAVSGRSGELVVLSTCNRLELYALGASRETELVELIVEATGVSASELAPALYQCHGAGVVRHLARVAAGLESMVVGEPQILGQVAAAYSAAVAHGAAAHGLEALFRSAVGAGRRVRSETGIGRQAATVSSLAVRIAADVVGDLAAASTLVIGAGEMGEHALAALHDHGIRDLCIVSRTRARAERVASRFGGRAVSLDGLPAALAMADVVLCAAAAPGPVVTREMVASAMESRPARPLLLLDVGVPRNVEPAVGTIPFVRCYDLDELHGAAAEGRMSQLEEYPRAEVIVETETERCVAELRRLHVQPLIAEWRAQADSIRDTLLKTTLHRFEHLSDADRASLEAFSQALVKRILHTPTARLRTAAERGQSAGYALALRHLFGLDA